MNQYQDIYKKIEEMVDLNKVAFDSRAFEEINQSLSANVKRFSELDPRSTNLLSFQNHLKVYLEELNRSFAKSMEVLNFTIPKFSIGGGGNISCGVNSNICDHSFEPKTIVIKIDDIIIKRP